MDNIKYQGKIYHWAEEIITQISAEYVPDWTLYHALRESVQNVVDERTLSGCNVYHTFKEDFAYLQDNGRGVEFDDICFIGLSGKRGEKGVVGQHGEGEMVSFLVAARNGVKKIMASKTWLAIGKLVDVRGHEVLALDVYRRDKPRIGTSWTYSGLDEIPIAARAAWDSFAQTRGRRRQRIDNYDAGQLWTCGMKVNKLEDLALGYDLDITPGRDRGGFTWEQCKDEIKRILEKHATANQLGRIMYALKRSWTDPKEGYLDLDISPAKVHAAARSFSGSSKKSAVSWCELGVGDGPALLDAEERGLHVLKFKTTPPRWITDNLPRVRQVVGVTKIAAKDLPAKLQEVVDLVKPLFTPYLREEVAFKCVWKFADDKTAIACANGAEYSITFARSYLKKMDFGRFVEVIAHEAAHLYSGASDCTRAHTDAVEKILGKLASRLVRSGAQRERYLESEKKFKEYTR